jgi:hypothetical protein
MQNKAAQINRRISGGAMNLEERMQHQKELAERRRLWEEDFARRKEEERLQHAREELAREKQARLDSWMDNGGSPEDFDRAWPSIQTAILEERYNARQYARQARAEDIWS